MRTRPVAVADRDVLDLLVMETIVGLPSFEEIWLSLGRSLVNVEESRIVCDKPGPDRSWSGTVHRPEFLLCPCAV